MRIATIAITLAVMFLVLGDLPVGADGLSLGGCAELWVSVDSETHHPKRLQTAYFVTERMSATDLQLRYTLTRYDESNEGPEMDYSGKLIGRVTVFRNGAVFFQTTRKRERMKYSTGEEGLHSKSATVSWGGIALQPGDIVLFTARFKNMARLWTSGGYAQDAVKISGEIYDFNGN